MHLLQSRVTVHGGESVCWSSPLLHNGLVVVLVLMRLVRLVLVLVLLVLVLVLVLVIHVMVDRVGGWWRLRLDMWGQWLMTARAGTCKGEVVKRGFGVMR